VKDYEEYITDSLLMLKCLARLAKILYTRFYFKQVSTQRLLKITIKCSMTCLLSNRSTTNRSKPKWNLGLTGVLGGVIPHYEINGC